MYPQQQFPGPPNQGNPYDFILNPADQPKKSRIPGGNNPFLMKIVFILGGAFLLIIILAFTINLFTKSGSNIEDYVALAQTQNELIRVSRQGSTTANQQTTKSLAVTTEFTMKTQQLNTLTFLGEYDRKVSPKELGLKQNAETDRKFTSARQTSTFDMVFSEVLQEQLEAYSADLKKLHGTADNNATREMLSNYYTQTQMLISQVPYAQQSIQAND